MSRFILTLVSALPLTLAAAGCVKVRVSRTPKPAPAQSVTPAQPDAPTVAGQRAAEAWLRLVDRGMHDASYDSAAVSFRQSVTRPQWRDAVVQARTGSESFSARRLIENRYTTSLPNAPPGEYVLLQYETDVAGGRKVIETVATMKDPDGRWRVTGYFVRPL